MNAQVQPILSQAPAVVVFGRDETGKPHASSFDASEVALAKKAAGLMGMSVLPVTTEAERALAVKVPRGRVFASGKGFVPFIKGALFAELEAACPPDETTNGEETPRKPSGGKTTVANDPKPNMHGPASETVSDNISSVLQPTHWGEIEVGAIVLAAAGPKHTEWYECLVIKFVGEEFTLRYCDWPQEPPFVRQRTEIGLMHPSREPEPPLEADAASLAD